MIKAFIFDLDGVITDTAMYHMQAWQFIARQNQLEFNETVNEKLKGISRMESLDIILSHNNITWSDQVKYEVATQKNNYYQTLLTSITKDSYLPGIEDLLKELKRKGYKIGLASASKNAPAIINALKAEHYFDVVVDPSSVKLGKPAPDIFLKAANYFLLKPSACIGVEDAKSGIEAINGAGMFSVGVGDALKQADYQVSCTKELTLSKILQAYENRNK